MVCWKLDCWVVCGCVGDGMGWFGLVWGFVDLCGKRVVCVVNVV